MKLKSATDLLIVAILALLSIWSVRPLLEEWGFMAAFRAQGIGYLTNIQGLVALRPLHIVPPVAQWVLGFGHPIGYGIVAALLIAARYAVCYWAVSPFLSARDRTLFATLAAVFVGWHGQWLSRFNPAQLSAIMFFAALGLCLRIVDRRSVKSAVLVILCLVAMLMTYQALALCALAVPAFVFLARPDVDLNRRYLGATWSGLSIAGGFVVYFIYTTIMSLSFENAYEQGVISALLSGGFVSQLSSFVGSAYQSAYLGGGLVLPIFVLIAGICFGTAYDTPGVRAKSFLLWGSGIALLPLASLVYLNGLHLNDPERVLFPTSVAFCMLALVGLARSSRQAGMDSWKHAIILCAIVAAGLSALEVRREWNFQTSIIDQLQAIHLATGASDMVLIDETGRLGDVYTFLPGILPAALLGLGTPIQVEICTPAKVDRLHNVARRYPIPTTPRCDEIDFASRLQVFATSSGGDVVLSSR